jgi:hypothetical protein
MSNEEIYQKLMESRKQNPKHYGLTSIAVEYEDLRNYSRSEKKDEEELQWRTLKLSERIKEVMNIYKLSIVEIAEYFRFHNYSLDFV